MYIEIENLTKKLKGRKVLDNVNVSLEKGGIYGFVGVNGSGKTMLFRAVCGLMRPTEGCVRVDGKRITKDISAPKNLGVIIENAGLWQNYSGMENLKLLTKYGKKISDDQIADSIRRVGLDPKDKRPVRKYSLGMKQRIALAQAIMEKPELLVLDEPTSSLDESGVEAIRTLLLKEKERGATILIASHNKEDIKSLCDKIYRMQEGKIVGEEDKSDFESAIE